MAQRAPNDQDSGILVSIILPTYNERDNIKELIPAIDAVMRSSGFKDRYEILVVDDNSPDGTAQVAQELAARYPVRVIVRKNERGLSSAVIRGIREARGEVCVVMDADFQHPPEAIPKLVEKILQEGYELAIASRYVEQGGIENWSFHRKLISKVANGMAYVLFPELRGIKDLMSGYFAFRRSFVLKKIDELDPLGFKILLEILVKTQPSKVAEVPYVFKERRYGKSKLGSKVIMEYVIHLLKLSKHSKFYPGKFALVGLLGALVNFLVYNLALLLLPSNSLGTLIAWLLGVEAGILNNFFFHEHWTFAPEKVERTRVAKLKRLAYFHATNAGYLAITSTVILLASLVIPRPRIDWLLAIIVGYIWNYTIARKIIWRS
jgi:dolichol-phosphate mannosyltransferase